MNISKLLTSTKFDFISLKEYKEKEIIWYFKNFLISLLYLLVLCHFF